jgi:RND superfamily putative drug exporter
VIGSEIFDSIAAGTIAVVACAVIGSVTVLPAVLELLGANIDRGRVPFLPHLRTETGDSRFWPAVIDRVLRRPVLSCVTATAVLVALALPVLSISVAKPSDDSLASQDEPALASLAHVRAAFPSTSAPAIVVVSAPVEQGTRVLAAIARLERLAEGRGLVHPPFRLTGNAGGTVGVVELPLTGAGDNDASRHAVEVLRDELVPVTLGRVSGVETAVTGDTAEDIDFTNQMKHGMPYVIAFVLVLASVLLFFAFRSIVVPLKAIVLNLLSVGAAYGVLVLVFQHEWAEPILRFESNGSIVSWLPPFLFVILFGLSMDYHVFILSRVREGVDAGMASDAAVRYGITATAGVVTSAALVMVGVFSIFGTLSSLDVKQAGVGMAVAVLIDATIVRAVLLPSSMHLLGEWNWYLPSFLGRLVRRPAAGDTV